MKKCSGVEECALRARSTHGVHHAIVEVNIVIGVVLGELHVVVRVHAPLVVCDDAVIDLTLVLIALVVIVVFVVAIFHRILLYGRYTVYRSCVPATRRLWPEPLLDWCCCCSFPGFLALDLPTHSLISSPFA